MIRLENVARSLLLLFGCAVSASVHAFDVRRLTIEELMELNIYSAARRDESVRASSAAVYVLTGEDIRRSRVTSVPEALRLVPGVQVARVDANKWAVSIRGFNNRAANKLQVLVDGRSIYDPLFSGVLWESRDIALEIIDRIEVIRGPGGTLWGANAVNGVINIITKHTRDTLGSFAYVGGGTEERAFGGIRYGWQADDRQSARISARIASRDQSYSPFGTVADDWLMKRAGYRWDYQAGGGNDIMLSGDVYDGRAGQYFPPGNTSALPGATDGEHRGGNVHLNWRRRLTDAGMLQVRAYYERFRFDSPNLLGEQRNIYHAEFQHDLPPTPAHRLVWGGNYRITDDEIENGPVLAFDPDNRTDRVVGAFVQDTIALASALELTVGTKVEHNDYTGTAWQPNVRLVYLASAEHAWWGAVSRAVRTPSRLDADLVFNGTPVGDRFDIERLTAYELGHRWQPSTDWSLDTALFYNAYDDLQTIEDDPTTAATDIRFGNRMQGHTYGVEFDNRWQLRPDVRMNLSYAYLRMNLDVEPAPGTLTEPADTEGAAPRHTLAWRTEWDMSRDFEIDATVRYVDALPTVQAPASPVPAYVTLDLGIDWRLARGVDLSLVGQNLLDSHHPEQPLSPIASTTEVQRGFYARLNWRF